MNVVVNGYDKNRIKRKSRDIYIYIYMSVKLDLDELRILAKILLFFFGIWCLNGSFSSSQVH